MNKNKTSSVSLIYALTYKSKEFSYSIEKKIWKGNDESVICYYTSLTVCKDGIAYHGLMSRKEKGFKTVDGAKAQLRALLLKIGRNTSIQKDIAKLPLFEGWLQTSFKF